jgi:ubiquitin C-terminal hydrolase
MEGENQFITPDGKRIDVAIVRLFQDVPPFLLFKVERFAVTNGKGMKNSSNFLCPDSIDMSRFMVNNIPSRQYKLAGMICHRGNIDCGYYLTYVLNEDGESFVRLDSIGGEIAATISKDDFMKSNDFIKNSYLALYVCTGQLP